uniref:Uncharacterized protein n=1 Tax=Panagrolaimus davidi TaxID=227884 RepID=A0A914R5P9_9BILA
MVSYTSILIFLTLVSFSLAAGWFDDIRQFFNRTDSENDNEEFSKLLSKFKFRLNGTLDERMENYRRAKKRISEFAAKHKKAKFGVNKFSLMSDDEQKNFLGVDPSSIDTTIRAERSPLPLPDAPVPTSLDYRTRGKVTPVKDQRRCGSCWAFTAVAAIESQYLLQYNETLDLSEQDLVDCYKKSCGGGDVTYAMKYITANGITNEACRPYNGSAGTCDITCNSQKYFIEGYHKFGKDESLFAEMLAKYGPATMIFHVPREMMSYESGILDFPGEACKAVAIGGHAVLIVGYTPEYWIAKNSWGDDWGENGFFRFKRGQNFCGMTSQVAVPYLNASKPLPSTLATTTTTKAPTTTTLPMTGCPQGNRVTTFTNEQRFQILDWFNTVRSQTIKGQYVMKNGELSPTGRDMNMLTYNCGMEAALQTYADTCDSSATPSSIFQYSMKFGYKASINESFFKGLPPMYAFTATPSDALVTPAVIGKARFAYADATSIACAYTSSPTCFSATTKTVLVCGTTPVQKETEPLYFMGTPCSQNSHCTKSGVDKCNVALGLCYA